MQPLLLILLCKTPVHFSMRATCLTHLRHLGLITELILGEDYNQEAHHHVFVTIVCTSPTAVPALHSAPCGAQPTAVCLNAYSHCPQFVQPYNSHCTLTYLLPSQRSYVQDNGNHQSFQFTAVFMIYLLLFVRSLQIQLAWSWPDIE